MNVDHYERMMRVSAKCLGLEIPVKKGQEAKGIAELFITGSDFWDTEFPKEKGFGETVRLDLSGADLRGCFFPFSGPCRGANFRDAILDRTKWLGTHVHGADFTRASLRECVTLGLCCEGAIFRGADLSGAQILRLIVGDDSPPADFSDANLSGAEIVIHGPTPLILKGTNLSGCRVSADVSGDASDKAWLKKGLEKFMASLSEKQRSQIVFEHPTKLGGESRCFIATAACGTDMHEHVVLLREFRETALRPTAIGRDCIAVYEFVSPPIAEVIARSFFLRRLVRSFVVRPAAFFARNWLDTVSEH
jgi:hypothetical protein